jgi:predicted enzyme related to lactoylglutathione lyase
MQEHHRINYIEFGAPDLEAVKVFYGSAFGFTFTDYGPDYVAFNDGTLDGGFARGPASPGGPLVILFSNDLEKSVQQVEDAGGVIKMPIYPFPGGRRFHFLDPAGNELAVWGE